MNAAKFGLLIAGLGGVALLPTASIASENKCTLTVATLPVTMEGHRASVPAKVNGRDTNFWLDSGAFFSIMSKAKAVELGLPLSPAPFGLYVTGIGGSASVEVATIKSFGIIGSEIRNVQFLVGGSDAGNGLIGRNLLAHDDTEFDLANGTVKLVQPRGCTDTSMAYWAGAGKAYFTVPLLTGLNPNDHILRLPVVINGARIEAEIDSGAPASLITQRAAERAGIDLTGGDVAPSNGITGLGRRFEKGWVAPVANVSVGDEEILHTHLYVMSGNMNASANAPDMLLGADFLLAHHVYVSRGQHRIYFTYSGGNPFAASTAKTGNPASSPPSAAAIPAGKQLVEAVANAAAEPKSADDFARRGAARLAQHGTDAAIADLNEAIRLSPDTPAYYGERAMAYNQSKQGKLARDDLDKAITLDPANGSFHRMRAFSRFVDHDKAGALEDAEAAAKLTSAGSLDMVLVAQLFERIGQPARTIPLYDAIIAAHRDDAKLGTLLNARCWARALANTQLDEALDDCNRAIKQIGTRAAILDSRGLVHFRQGEYAEAVADYDQALQINASIPWSLYVRGLAKAALGQADAGKSDRAAALAIKSDMVTEAGQYGIGP